MSLTVLVTGANGFVGRALCQELAERGYNVRAAVRARANFADIPGEIIAVGALSGDTDWFPAVAGVDVIVHLAARVHVMTETESDPLAAFRKVNVDATVGLARAAALHGIKRLVYVSSIKVNGEATFDLPFREDGPVNPVDAYGMSKLEAEQSLWSIANASGMQVAVMRPPLVYGPGVGGNLLRLLHLIERGIPLPFASIRNQRSMIYRGNLTHALIACATDLRAAGNTFLVSDGEDLSTPVLMKQLAQVMGVRLRLWSVSPALLSVGGRLIGKSAEIERLVGSLTVDNSGLRSKLDWTPPFTVEEGLSETVHWFRENQRSTADL